MNRGTKHSRSLFLGRGNAKLRSMERGKIYIYIIFKLVFKADGKRLNFLLFCLYFILSYFCSCHGDKKVIHIEPKAWFVQIDVSLQKLPTSKVQEFPEEIKVS